MDALAQLNSALAGRYTLDREIGRGGMATVFLARDVRHNRSVALKLLNPELGAVLGVERFLAEIQVTANLQHPNLLPLFDSGEVDGLLFYVMPYVAGESLRAKLTREKQLPLEEAIGIAVAVANALDYAHRHGVIHRDLKPENVLLHEGQPLVADFGIALAVSNAGGSRITQTGISLGTPHYMSPEQATGDRVVDARTDVYSLGAVTYELLTGEPPHSGTTAQAVIARVLMDKPRSIRLSRDTVPLHVEYAVDRALAKLPADRFQTARDFAEAIQGRTAAGVTRDGGSAGKGETPVTRVVRGRVLPWGIAALAIGVAAASLVMNRGRPQDSPAVRFTMEIPVSQQLVLSASFGTPVAISPDGRTIVYSGRGGRDRLLYARRLDQMRATPISGTETGRNPMFSPDGKWLGFLARTELRVVPAEGGPAATLAQVGGSMGPTGVAGFTWLNNEEIVFAERSLMRVSRVTREAKAITEAPPGGGPGFPLAVPGEDYVLLRVIRTGNLSSGKLAVASLKTGEITELPVDGFAPLALSGDKLIYVINDGSVMQIGFDRKRRTIIGAPAPTGDTVWTNVTAGTAAAVSANGSLVYVSGNNSSVVEHVDAQGRRSPLLTEAREYAHPRLSPDGRKLAIEIAQLRRRELWVLDIASATLTKVTNRGIADRPEWSPDGQRLVFALTDSGPAQAAWQLADGSAAAEVLYTSPNPIREVILTPDGKSLLFREDHPIQQRDVWLVPLAGDRTRRPLFTTNADELMARVSPNGRWVVYVSNESGQQEVYVRGFPGGGQRVQISSGGGMEPLWSRDSRRIYYRNGREMMMVTLLGDETLSVGTRVALFEDRFASDIFHPNYDVTNDGRSFIMLTPVSGDLKVVVVMNWLEELRARDAAR
jgi:Tol biopolymer transport system component